MPTSGLVTALPLFEAPYFTVRSGGREVVRWTFPLTTSRSPGPMDVTHTLARYLVSSRPADIPARVRHEAARALLNWLGCAIGASRHETTERALAAVREFAGPPQAAVMGRTERLDILNAAFVNGLSSHVLDFD